MAETKNIFTTGGTVQAGGGIYIKRAVDDELLNLCRQLEFVFVLSARQLGKSSLMVHTAERLAVESFHSVIVDFSALGVKLSPDQWYLGILKEIASSVKLQTDIFSWWVEHNMLGQAQRLTTFFREVLLREVDKRVIIFFDEIDSTLSIPFADDFFAALRAVYNARATTPSFSRLAFVLIGVATPSDLIRNNSRTPINIGKRVELKDFEFEEALPLVAGFEKNAFEVLAWILEWTGGHPYLTQLLCEHLAKNSAQITKASVSLAVTQLFDGEKGRQDHNLQFVRDMLTRRSPNIPLTIETYENICKGANVTDDESSVIKSHLKISGIVINKEGYLVVRNRIYENAFDTQWIKENSPRITSLPQTRRDDGGETTPPIQLLKERSYLASLVRWVIIIVLPTIGLSTLVYYIFNRWTKGNVIDYVVLLPTVYVILVILVILVIGILFLQRDKVEVVAQEIGERVKNPVYRLTNRLRKLEPKARLVVIQGIADGSRKEFDLFGDTPIGRSNTNAELIFDNDNISRLHCVIHERRTGDWTIEDMESVNGTFVDSQKILPFVEKEIDSGALIELGPVEYGGIKFRFEVVDVFSGNDDLYSNVYDESDAAHENETRITKNIQRKHKGEDKIKPYDFGNEFDPSDPANQKW